MTTNNYQFVPFDFPTTQDGQFFCALDGAGILRSRREQLGLTMQQVAEMAGLQFSQYQRLESGERSLDGCSMKVGLSVCATLLLDPYEMVGISAKQKDPAELKPQTAIVFKYSMKLTLFSRAVVVGLPRSSLAPIEHLTSIRLNSFLFFASASSLSKASKESTETE